MGMGPQIVIGLNAVITAVTNEIPRILTVQRPRHDPANSLKGGAYVSREGEPLDALPFGPLDPQMDRTLELGLRRWVREQTGIELGYVEQLYTFGDRDRDAAESLSGPRDISVAYLTLVREEQLAGASQAAWRDWYEYFPWEDWRSRRPPVIDEQIAPALAKWAKSGGDAALRQRRRERAEITFGLNGAPWDEERVLERYELLYEVGLVAEQVRDRRVRAKARSEKSPQPPPWRSQSQSIGRPMILDHRRISATALGRLRGKIKYRPVVFELPPPTFTLLQLQRVVEALAGVRLHKQNFRRLLEKGGLVERTGQFVARTGGRPAELFRFRREVLRERSAPGVGLPGALRGG